MTRRRIALLLAASAVTFGGCAAVAVDADVDLGRVAGIVEERAGREVAIDLADGTVRDRVRALLAGGLTADSAVDVALLDNRDLRALYTALGVARADVVQASLLHNPVAGASAGVPVAGGTVDLTLGLAMDVVDLLYAPLRQRVAEARFEEALLRVAAGVLDLAWRAEGSFYRHQANEQMAEIRRQVAQSTAAAASLAERMRAAGNLRALDADTERALAEESKIQLRIAEIAARQSREELNRSMGLWGEDAAWELASPRLADPPAQAPDLAHLESRAVERSLELAGAERLVVAAAENVGLDRASGLFPEIVVGGLGERDQGDWEPGPSLSLPLPFFDRGQARVARAEAELRRARETHHALAVRVRSVARAARDRLEGHRDLALHYRNVVLPLRERVVRDTELQYNAMQAGPLDLLRAKEQQIDGARGYVDALREYWTAHADVALLVAGGLPSVEPSAAPPALEQLPRFPFPTLQ